MESITDDEREVCEILLNLHYSIKKSESCFNLPGWGVRGRRSAIDLTPSPPHQRRPEKKQKVAAGETSPATPLSFSPSESDDKAHQSPKTVPKKKTREELLETIKELVQAREWLTRELERVKDYYNNLEAYNKVLRAKQQELQFRQSEPKTEMRKDLSLGLELSRNKTPFPFLLENHQEVPPQFLGLLQQQHFIFQYPCKQTPPVSLPPPPPPTIPSKANLTGRPGLPDLNVSVDEVLDAEYLQPSTHNVQGLRDSNRARAAEARKRRMVRVKQRKLNISPFKPPKC